MTMTMSERDKKLLIYLGAALIIAAAYFLVGRPYLDKIDALSSERIELQAQLSEKQTAYAKKADYIQGIDEAKIKKQQIMDEFPEKLSQEKSIMFTVEAEKEVPVWFRNIHFAEDMEVLVEDGTVVDAESASDREEAALQEKVAAVDEEETGNSTGAGEPGTGTSTNVGLGDLVAVTNEVSMTYETDYAGFKNLMAYVRDYDERLVLKEIDASYNSDTRTVSGNMILTQYAITGAGREIPIIETGLHKDDLGTGNIFVAQDTGTSLFDALNDAVTKLLAKLFSGDSGESVAVITNEDYFIKLNLVSDNTNGKTIGKANDVPGKTYLVSRDNGKEDITFSLNGSKGDYSITYVLGNQAFNDQLEKTDDGEIVLRVISTERSSENDKVEADLHLINNSDRPLSVKIEGDDVKDPRVDVVEKKGEITVAY